MQVMLMVKATAASESGRLPSSVLLNAMGKYNEELAEAGTLLGCEGLRPSSQGVRVRFDGADRSVAAGPFPETDQLVAGFWLWQVESLEEAIEWVNRCPNPMEERGEIEIRPVAELEDFGENVTAEMRERGERLRAAN